jgi:hypothetical protein
VTYAADIASLTDQYVTNNVGNTSMTPLTAALGCTHVPYMGQVFRYRVKRPVQPPVDYDDVTTMALVTAMHKLAATPGTSIIFYCDAYAVLSGLSKNERWRACVGRNADVHAFATLLAYFDPDCEAVFTTRSPQAKNACARLRHTIEPEVRALLNAWVQPSIPYKKVPPLRILTLALFGTAWCSIAISSSDQPLDVARLIRSTQPPLVPALMPAAPYEALTELPVLGGL